LSSGIIAFLILKIDVDIMSEVLLRYKGFDESDILVLKDDGSCPDEFIPTGANIRKALTKLCSEAEEDDILFVHFSGHGTQVPADDDDDDDEDDNKDEVRWVCLVGSALHARACPVGLVERLPTRVAALCPWGTSARVAFDHPLTYRFLSRVVCFFFALLSHGSGNQAIVRAHFCPIQCSVFLFGSPHVLVSMAVTRGAVVLRSRCPALP